MTLDPTKTIFYAIEKTIKEYRRYAQYNISSLINDITLDQALVLTIINSEPDISQKEIARYLYKDYASITRIIELMVSKSYLRRKIKESDKRRAKLIISQKGKVAVEKLIPIIKKNRTNALLGLSLKETTQLNNLLNKITNNCLNKA